MSNMIETVKVTDEVYAFRHWMGTPFGFLPIVSYAMLGKEPILVDTHAPICRAAFFEAVWKVVDPKDVRSVFITHDDRDHTGNLVQTLEACPNASFVLPIVGAARLGEEFQLPMQRIRVTNPGEKWEANGRTFGVIRPIAYDSPSTVGLYDAKSSVFFASDCYGAFVPKPVNEVGEVPTEDYARGFGMFQTVNSPWINLLKGSKILGDYTKELQALAPKTILSAHGPVASNRLDELSKLIFAAVEAPEFRGPTHEQVMQMMAGPPPGH